MAEIPAKKSGFSALFGRRSSRDTGGQKKLSKKSRLRDADPISPNDYGFDAGSTRQDSGSFTSQSVDLGLDGSLGSPPPYEAINQYGLHTYRDSPYSAINSHAGRAFSGLPWDEDRRNSEGQQPYHGSPYLSRPQRSASVPEYSIEQAPVMPLPPPVSRPQPSRLTKTHRKPMRADDILDKDTGERKDLTDMMHAFTFSEGMDTVEEEVRHTTFEYDYSRPDGMAILGRASPEIWLQVADFLSPLDVANLSSTCRTMYARLGRHPYKLLLDATNRPDRLAFLLAMDHKLPRHLFCFVCAQWHLRIQPGFETLKPHNVLNPLFDCPNRTNMHRPPPRLRISENRMLPFAFVQLVRRAWEFGPDYGISHRTLARRWKDTMSNWTHDSMYHVTDQGNVLMRVRSQHYVEGGMTAAAKRMLLYSRGDYTPYFSVCSHWKNGILMSIPKCALDHIPFTAEADIYVVEKLRDRVSGSRKAPGLVHLCTKCRPMRRCPECPTEYLFELKLVEDKTVRGHGPERFKQALIVTRWSDLGPGHSPDDKQWAATVGESGEGAYDSFEEIGKRAISGVFESAFAETVPGQRILSSNPQNVRANEEGGDWY